MKRVALALAAIVLVGAGVVSAFVLYRRHQGRDIRGSSTVEFVTTVARPPPNPELSKVPWPTYGRVPERTRDAVGLGLKPPFRKIWTYHAGSLVEFPPVVGYRRLYFATNAGDFTSINARTGKRAWRFRSHRCVAASPTIHDHVVFAAFMNRPPCNAAGGRGIDGEVIAFAVGFGRIRWRTSIGPSESSPLVAGGLVYVGDWGGNVYALAERTGKIRWRFHTNGQVKGALAVSGNRLFVGSYDGHVYCLDARTGKKLWRAAAQPRIGHSGTFYSTPAVAYGRVYIGSTDGKVYSYGATSGTLRWSHHTGGYVYSSPAVWNRLVFVGSYDSRLYAFDAATGDVRWTFKANGPISGSPTVIDGVVYFATLAKRTYALAGSSGKLLWTYPDGKYTPAVAETHRLYLVGYGQVYGMEVR
ncbi:MAG: PQQ-binding-like beta-propeller repeat protein [Gaiellaceae bacterium]